MSHHNSTNAAPVLACRPYPWKCGDCKERSVKPAIVEYTCTIAHDGRKYTVTVPDLEIPRCEKCGYMVMISEANRRIDDALRQQLDLLPPDEIREHREKLRLTQKQLAARVGVDEATVSRWETGGQIQQKAMDNVMRLFFKVPEGGELLGDSEMESDNGSGATRRVLAKHSEHSSFREKLLEHLFLGALLRYFWKHDMTDVEILKPEVDNSGYDLVISFKNVTRHIQLKTSHRLGKAKRQKVHERLWQKPSGCVIWIKFDEQSLDLGPFLWFGGDPGNPLPKASRLRTAKHTKGDSKGHKADRPKILVVPDSNFEEVSCLAELVARLFRPLHSVPGKPDSQQSSE